MWEISKEWESVLGEIRVGVEKCVEGVGAGVGKCLGCGKRWRCGEVCLGCGKRWRCGEA